ncbi:MAG TPA: hemolysin family protein [Treponemataceae bacterium]|nr:hemolysin family protein [Treponemataceae bacterium]
MVFIIILLLFFSAFFSFAETALLSLNKAQLKQLLKTERKQGKRIAILKNSMDQVISIILIGSNFFNTLSSAIATALAIDLIGPQGALWATLIMLILIILFGEIIPKNIAALYPKEASLLSAPILTVLLFVFKPIAFLFSLLQKGINKIEGALWKNKDPIITEEELKTLIALGDKEGTLELGEKDMLYNIFELNDLRAKDIMRHRSLIKTCNINASLHQSIEAFEKSGYSRLVVIEDSIDAINAIQGILHFKDLLFFDSAQDFSVKSIMRKPLFIPESKSVISLLSTFKKEKQNFAVIVDEHGSNQGIITMDDILKAVFGRITDEHNSEGKNAEERIQIIKTNQFLIPGELSIDDFNRIFKQNFSSEAFESIGGFLLEEFGYLPQAGEFLKRNNCILAVDAQSQRRIKMIKLTILKTTKNYNSK